MTTRFSRRRLLTASGGIALTNVWCEAAQPVAPISGVPGVGEALARLKAGNARFVAQQTQHAHQSADWRKLLVGGQHPLAIILGCSDSRVPPELVFDQGFGDLFVIRVAGNVIAEDVIGSIGYAIRHLRISLLVVLGHEGCGAVTAALEALAGKSEDARYIQALLRHIEPGLRDLDPALAGAARLDAAVEANVRWSAQQLARLPEGRRALDEKLLALVGAVYELKSGRVRFLE